MFSTEQLYTALENADAAGDVEAAKEIALMIQQRQPNLYPQKSQQPEEDLAGGPIESLIGGTKRYLSSIGTALDIGDTAEEAAKEGIERQEGFKERPGFSAEDIKKAYEEEGLLSAVGETASQIPGTVLEQFPILASIYAGGKAGAALPVPPQLKPFTILAGSAIAPYLSHLGNDMERKAQVQMERGEPVDISRAKAALTAVGQTAVERAALGLSGLSKVLGINVLGKQTTKELAKKNMALAIAGGTGRYLGVEIPTEIAQQAFERSYAGLDLLDEDAINEYGLTAAQVALTGPIGSVTGFVGERQTREKIKDQKTLESLNLANLRADAEKRLREQREADEQAATVQTLSQELIKSVNVANFGLESFIDTSDIKKQIKPFEDRVEELAAKAEEALANNDIKSAKRYIDDIDKKITPRITQKIDKFKDLKLEDIRKQTNTAIKGREFIAAELQKQADIAAEVKFENAQAGLLTDNILRNFLGLQRRSKTYKQSLGLDIKNPTNMEKFVRLLEDNQPNVNEANYNEYITNLNNFLEKQYDGNQIPAVYTGASNVVFERIGRQPDTRSKTDDRPRTTRDTDDDGLPVRRKRDEYTPLNASQDTISQTIETLANEIQQTSDLEQIAETGAQLENLNKLKTKLDRAKTKLAPKNLSKLEKSTLKTFLGEFVENTFRNQQALQDTNIRTQYQGALDTIRDLDKQTPFKDAKYNVQDKIDPETDELTQTVDNSTVPNPSLTNRVIRNKNLSSALTDLKNNFSDKLNDSQKFIVDRLLNTPNINTTSIKEDRFKDKPTQNVRGTYSPSANSVSLHPERANEVTVIHEAIHAATVSAIDTHLTKNDNLRNNSQLGQRLLNMVNAAKEADIDNQFSKELKDTREFVAYGLSDENFQKFLATTRSFDAEQSVISNLWNDFVNFVSKLLGLGDISGTVLNDLISVTPDLMQGPFGSELGRSPNNNTYQQADAEIKNTLDAPKRNSTGFFQGMLNKINNPDVPKDSFGDLYLKARVKVANFYAKSNETLMDEFNGAVKLNDQVRADLYLDQALHTNALAANAAENGKLIFNEDGFAEVIPDTNNLNSIFVAINKLSETMGPEQARQAVQRFLAGKAFLGRQQLNEDLSKRVDDLRDEAEYLLKNKRIEPDAKRRAAARKNEADRLEKQISTITPEQIRDSEEAVNEFGALPEIRAISEIIRNINLAHIDLLQQAQVVTNKTAEEYRQTADWYVPLFRQIDESNEPAAKEYFRGFSDIGSEFEFRGSEKEVLDILDNFVKKHFWISNAAIRNKANIKNAEALAVRDEDNNLKTYPNKDSAPKEIRDNLAQIYLDGRQVYVEYTDPYFAMAIAGSEVPVNDLGKYMSGFAKTLRLGVTANPVFQAYQVFSDAIGAGLFSGVRRPFQLGMRVLDSYRRATFDADDPILRRMAQLGIVGGFYGYDTKDPLKNLRVKYKLEDDTAIKKLIRNTDAWAANSDVAQRRALFEQTLLETGGIRNADGSVSGGNEILAMNRATNIINWQKRGQSGFVRGFVHLIPFANAYIQGMDVMVQAIRGKNIAGTDKARATSLFIKTALQMMTLNALYSMLIGAADEDDEYASMDDREKLRSYFIPGTGFKMPVRAEIALLTKMIPELSYNVVMREGTINEYDMRKIMRAVGMSFTDAMAGPNILPQAIRPTAEVFFNRNFFTDRPIVGMGMEFLETSRKYTDYTSEMGKIVGKTGLMAPVNFDHLMRGYFGTMGTLALQLTDGIATLLFDVKRPPLPLDRIALVSPILKSPIGRDRLNDFYDLRQMSESVNSTLNDMIKKGDYKQAEKLAKNEAKLIGVRKAVLKFNRRLQKIRDTRKQVIADDGLTEKRKMKILEALDKETYLTLQGVSKLRQEAGL